MTTSLDIKLALERLSMEKGVIITGLHSIVVEDGVVHALYDTAGPDGNDLLSFEFPFPTVISREELQRFSVWLAASDYAEMVTIH